MAALENFNEADVRQTLRQTLRLLIILTLIGAAIVGLKLGWRSALMLVIGSVISGSGLWEWMRLMSAVLARMDAASADGAISVPVDQPVRPMGLVLTGFFLRLGATIAVLYVSLKLLNGSVLALAAGIGLGIVSLTIEAIRMARTWTV
jgi:type IV secretory pathway VirB2 component (pilin)